MRQIGSQVVYEGPIADVRLDRFERDSGQIVDRQVIAHKGAVGVLAHDEDRVYLVRQPREAVGENSLLEIPAGLLDKEGEQPIEAAKRELVEEVGLQAGTWKEIYSVYPSPGSAEESIMLFEATDLEYVGESPDGDEELEIVALRKAEIKDMLGGVKDAKTLICLLDLHSRT